MGRPTKKQQALKALEEMGIDLQDLLKEFIPEPEVVEVEKIVEVEKVVEKVVEVPTEQEKEIEDSTRLEVRNNLGGTFVLKAKGTNLHKLLNGYGTKTRIKYSDLDAFYGEHPRAIQNGSLAITKVIDKGISFEQLIEDVGLEDLYLNDDKISPKNIESLFSDDVDPSRFSRLVDNTPEVADTLLEVSYELWRNGKFNDNTKMNKLRQLFRNPELFSR